MTSVTLRYITDTTTSRVITVKDVSFDWIEEFWGEKELSITGKKRNNHRGYRSVLRIEFENDEQLNTVAKEIYDTLSDGTVQYFNEDGAIPVVPSDFISSRDYVPQISIKPSTLVLEGNIQSTRQFNITGILCGATDVFCGQTDVLCGG